MTPRTRHGCYIRDKPQQQTQQRTKVLLTQEIGNVKEELPARRQGLLSARSKQALPSSGQEQQKFGSGSSGSVSGCHSSCSNCRRNVRKEKLRTDASATQTGLEEHR